MATPLRQSITLDIEQQKRALREAKAGMQDYSRTSEEGVSRAHDGIGRSAGRMSTIVRGALAGLVTFIATRVLGAIRQVATELFTISTNVEETASRFQVTFQDSSEEMEDFRREFALMAGLTTTEFRDLATRVGTIMQGFGADAREVVDNTEQVLRFAGDLASFHEESIENTFAAIRSGLVGETEPMKRFGIIVREQAVTNRALADSGKTVAEQLTEWERVQARLNIMLEQAGVVNQDLVRTQDSLSNTTRRTLAQLREQREEFAARLNPAYQAAIGYLTQLVDLYSDSADTLGGRLAEALTEITRQLIEFTDEVRQTIDLLVRLGQSFEGVEGSLDINLNPLEHLRRELEFVNNFLERFTRQILQFRLAGARVAAAVSEITGIGDPEEPRRLVAELEKQLDSLNQMREATERLRKERESWRKTEEDLIDLFSRQSLSEMIERQTVGFTNAANILSILNKIPPKPQAGAEGAPSLLDQKAIESARDAMVRVAQATRAAQAATRQEQRALAEVLRAREMIAEIERSQAALGTERFAEELAFWQRKLALAQEELDKSVEIREAVRQAASASEDFVRRLRAALQIRPTERSVFDLFQRGGGISPDALRSVGLTAEEAERLENSLRGADEATGGVSDALDGLAASVRSVTRFVDLFGDLSEETRMVADGVADVIDNIAALDRLGVDASAIQALPSIIGAVAGVGSIIGGLISAIQSEREEERRLIEALRQNSRALREFSESLFEGGRVGQGFSEEQIDAARALFQQLLSPGMSIEGAGPIVEQLERLGLPGFEEISGTFSAFFEALFNRVLNERPGDIISGRITADDLFQQAIQIFFGGADPGQFADLLPSDFEPIQDLLNRLADSLGEFTNDVEGAVQRFRFMGRFLGVEGQAAVDAFIQSILEIEGITPNLRDALVSLMEIDTSTEEGQAQFEAELRALAERFAEGGEALDGWLGALDADEFEQILEVLFGHISDFGEKVEEVVDNLDDLIRDRLENISDAFAFADRLGLDANTLRNIILENFEEIFSASGITGLDQGFLNRIQGLDLSTPEGRQQLKFWTDALAEAILRGTTAQFGLTEEQARQLLESLDGLFRVAQEDDDFTRSVQIARSITEVQANEFIAIAETQLFELRKHTELLEELLLSVSIPSPLRGAIGSLTPEPIMLPAQGTHQITSRLVNVTVNANGVTVDSLVNEIGERLEEEVYRLERAFS